MGIFSFVKAGKKTFEIVKPKIAKNLTKLRKIKDEGFKSVDDQTKGTNVTNQKKAEIKKSFGKKVTDIINPVKKAKGGRIGRRFGGDTMKRKTNVQKIKETFGPKNTKKLSSKQMKIAKLAGNPKKIDAQDLAKLRGRG